MPELPEVETICRTLKDSSGLINRHVTNVNLLWKRTLASPSHQVFKTSIIGQELQDVERRGKYILFRLSSDWLVIHLRMSGDLRVEASDSPNAKHHRLTLDFDNGYRLAFNDTRKFGRVWLVNSAKSLLAHLGPEPLEDSFTPQLFFTNLQQHRRQIKPLLLEQRFIAGIGNIYADEALHQAQVHPQTQSNMLNFEQAERLWCSIRDVLSKGIQRNGASIDWIYRGGSFQNYFQVYQRTGKPCYQCNNTIVRIRVGQRGTHYCPQCQSLPEKSRDL